MNRIAPMALIAAAVAVIVVGFALVVRLPNVGPPSVPSVEAEPWDYAGGAWTATGSMAEPRSGHTATRLRDGTVLVTGGADRFDNYAASAELYDPLTGTWTAVDASGAGSGHTATLLNDGRVLVAGGQGTGDSAELYNPTTGTWAATGTMTETRGTHTATLLPDGTVLVVGGDDSDAAEVYDPSTGTWTATDPMISGQRVLHTATLMSDGRVLVAGGRRIATGGSSGLGSTGEFGELAEIYDPRAGTWTATSPLIYPSWEHTAALLPDGTVLLFGGEVALRAVTLYNPLSGAWTAAGSLNVLRGWGSDATPLPDGSVLVTGGVLHVTGTPADRGETPELYEQKTGTWTTIANMIADRRYHTATLLLDGRVLVVGGALGMADPASAEVFGPVDSSL